MEFIFRKLDIKKNWQNWLHELFTPKKKDSLNFLDFGGWGDGVQKSLH